jgi:methyl-accepting chemotaxis protein
MALVFCEQGFYAMRRLSFSHLLLLIALIPAIALALFAGRMTYESWQRYGDLTSANSLLRLAVATSRFSGMSIPGEGAATRDFLAGGETSKLAAAQGATDTNYRAVREAAAHVVKTATIEQHLKGIDDKMRELGALRQKVETRTTNAGVTTGLLADIGGRGNDLVGSASALASDAVLARRILAFYATLQFSESSLMQRGAGQTILQDGKAPQPLFLLLARGVSLNGTFGKLFNDYAPPEMVRQYQAFDADNGKELQDLRELALKNSGTPAAEAQVKRWAAVNGQLTGVLMGIISSAADQISAEAEQMLSAAWRALLLYFGGAIAVLAIVVAITLRVLGTVRGLLVGLSRVMEALREGSYEITVPSVERNDEIGAMARATESFRENLVHMRAMEAEQKDMEARAATERQAAQQREAAQQRAAEDKAAAERKTAMHSLADQFEKAVGNIVQTVSSASTQLEAAADTLTKTAETTQQLSAVVASASDEASANVQSVASATEEMAGSVGEISRQVHESSKIANEAVKQAHKTDARISELSQAAGRIGDVVKLITAIAEQTNLLALNATIEAARAGDAGRGFAVVASEVKALASQTAKATEEIGTQISGMQAATNESVAAIKEIGGTIGRISEIAETIAAAVEQQGAATQEIARNVQEASRGTGEVATNIVSVNRGAAETSSASSQVLSSARSLSSESNHLRLEVQKFLGTVRAA